MKPRPSIRPARKADLAASARVSAAAWTRGQLEEKLADPRAIFLVADDGGTALGHALALVVLDEAQLVDVSVDPSSRRRGVGSALLAALLAAAARSGCARAALEVSARNAAALAFYRRAGFVVVGRRPKFYNDGADAVLMERELP